MARRFNTPRQTAHNRAVKELSAAGYTPMISRTFGEAMLVLCESSAVHRKRVLAAFEKIAKQKCKWPVVGKRY